MDLCGLKREMGFWMDKFVLKLGDRDVSQCASYLSNHATVCRRNSHVLGEIRRGNCFENVGHPGKIHGRPWPRKQKPDDALTRNLSLTLIFQSFLSILRDGIRSYLHVNILIGQL